MTQLVKQLVLAVVRGGKDDHIGWKHGQVNGGRRLYYHLLQEGYLVHLRYRVKTIGGVDTRTEDLEVLENNLNLIRQTNLI